MKADRTNGVVDFVAVTRPAIACADPNLLIQWKIASYVGGQSIWENANEADFVRMMTKGS